MAKKRCPICGGERFAANAHVIQLWEVDGNGEFVNCITDCDKITHHPDDDDIWECLVCSYSAAGKDFNIE